MIFCPTNKRSYYTLMSSCIYPHVLFPPLQDFETSLQAHEPGLERCQEAYQQLTPAQRSRDVEDELTQAVETWERLWAQSHLLLDRLRACEVLFASVEDLNQMVTEYELEFVSHSIVSSNPAQLKNMKGELQVRDARSKSGLDFV